MVRDVLIECLWDVNYFKNNPIVKEKGHYYVFKVLNNRILFYNSYKYRKVAQNAVSGLYWGKNHYNFNEIDERDIDVDDYDFLFFLSGKFCIKKSIKSRIYGYFDSLTQAAVARDKLVENNWDFNSFKDQDVIYDKGKYYAFNIKQGVIYGLGAFPTRADARNKIKSLEFNNYPYI